MDGIEQGASLVQGNPLLIKFRAQIHLAGRLQGFGSLDQLDDGQVSFGELSHRGNEKKVVYHSLAKAIFGRTAESVIRQPPCFLTGVAAGKLALSGDENP